MVLSEPPVAVAEQEMTPYPVGADGMNGCCVFGPRNSDSRAAGSVVATALISHTVGSFHLARYGISDCCKPLASGDGKTSLWRSHQEIGALYGRLINSGPMLYEVGHRPNAEPYP